MAENEGRAWKLAANQSAFRSANERMQRQAVSHRFEPGQGVPFLCECADPNCYESVMLSLEQYTQVRAHPSRFLLVAGHEDEDATHERIVEAERGYAIIEKVGTAGKEAARLHTRSGDAN
jgi:hypothetical protein